MVYRLKIAWNSGYRQVQLKVDNLALVQALKHQSFPCTIDGSILNRLKELLCQNWSIQVNHVYREANTCADWLANQGHQQPLGYLFLKAPPPTLHQWILNYFIRVSHFRMCLM